MKCPEYSEVTKDLESLLSQSDAITRDFQSACDINISGSFRETKEFHRTLDLMCYHIPFLIKEIINKYKEPK